MIDWEADKLDMHKDEAEARLYLFFRHLTLCLTRLHLPDDGFGNLDFNLAKMYWEDSLCAFRDWGDDY